MSSAKSDNENSSTVASYNSVNIWKIKKKSFLASGTRFPKLSVCNFIVMTLIVTQWTWQAALSVNILESVPPAEDGVLTVYAGQQISLTCSHDNIGS